MGDGTTTHHPAPGTVTGITTATRVATGEVHSLAVLKDGTVRAWGDNDDGQLGNGNAGTDSNVPVTVLGLSGITIIAAGFDTSLAAAGTDKTPECLDGVTLYTWEENNFGQLGNGNTG
ncbi:hypothetical protein [Streptomyces sp. NPDC000410]|uniref:hypothetical protein n=1 Tax=Streptomyces sp. NPDC000410 TaxID=3154254 RepID=UPI00332A1BC8